MQTISHPLPIRTPLSCRIKARQGSRNRQTANRAQTGYCLNGNKLFTQSQLFFKHRQQNEANKWFLTPPLVPIDPPRRYRSTRRVSGRAHIVKVLNFEVAGGAVWTSRWRIDSGGWPWCGMAMEDHFSWPEGSRRSYPEAAGSGLRRWRRPLKRKLRSSWWWCSCDFWFFLTTSEKRREESWKPLVGLLLHYMTSLELSFNKWKKWF